MCRKKKLINLTLERRKLFLRIEKGDLGEEGLEPSNDFGLLVLVLHRKLGLMRISFTVRFPPFSTSLLLVLQRNLGDWDRNLGVEGVLELLKKPNLLQLRGLGFGLGAS